MFTILVNHSFSKYFINRSFWTQAHMQTVANRPPGWVSCTGTIRSELIAGCGSLGYAATWRKRFLHTEHQMETSMTSFQGPIRKQNG